MRGAYLHLERRRAEALGYLSPIWPELQDTHAAYNACAADLIRAAAEGRAQVGDVCVLGGAQPVNLRESSTNLLQHSVVSQLTHSTGNMSCHHGSPGFCPCTAGTHLRAHGTGVQPRAHMENTRVPDTRRAADVSRAVPPLGLPPQVLLGTHNQDSVESAVQLMAELRMAPGPGGGGAGAAAGQGAAAAAAKASGPGGGHGEGGGGGSGGVMFGQLLGMSDHLTLTLGKAGYRWVGWGGEHSAGRWVDGGGRITKCS